MFAGGNTPKGFVSHFEHIVPHRIAQRILILKGGPGTGKSTLMKRLVEEAEALGLGVELFHCSADPDSLDAVFFPEIKAAVVDGTSPHVIDPQLPGAVDEIVHLAEHLDGSGLSAHREAIAVLKEGAGRSIRRAYRYLAAARLVYDELESLYGEIVDQCLLNTAAAELLCWVPQDRPQPVPGRIRRLFASAITPKGVVHFLEAITGLVRRRIAITGPPGAGKALVERLVRTSVECGFDVECFHCPFDPDRVEHAVIPALDLAVVTSAPPHVLRQEADHTVDAGAALSSKALCDRYPELKEAEDEYLHLFSLAISALKEARSYHDRIERYYAPHMDFARVDALYQQVKEKLFSLL